jgi:hypothetical protein
VQLWTGKRKLEKKKDKHVKKNNSLIVTWGIIQALYSTGDKHDFPQGRNMVRPYLCLKDCEQMQRFDIYIT